MPNSSAEIEYLENKARIIRHLIVKMIAHAGSGHPGGSLSIADIIACLYFKVLRHNPKKLNWEDRDRFHLSKGHACPAWYAALAEAGYFPKDKLLTLRQLGSILQGHPDRCTPGVDVASGSLGQGLSVALGMALAGKLDKKAYRVYCIIGDGELQEGNIWEAAMAASHYKLDNLCAVVDYNNFQIDGKVSEVMDVSPLKEKWLAFGWNVLQIGGHSMEDICNAFEKAKEIKNKPTVIIAKTTKGKGVSFMENVVDFHGRAPKGREIEQALEETDISDLEG